MSVSHLLRSPPNQLTSVLNNEFENCQFIRELMASFQSSFYFYDLDAFEKHLEEIKEILHPDITVWYATKANPLSEILRILKTQGFGADVASLGELRLAQLAGLKPENLIATGPAKSRTYLGSLLNANVSTIVIESLNQLRDLNEVCKKLSRYQDVLLRIQLDYEKRDKSVLGGQQITPFGLGVEDWKSISLNDFPNVRIKGIHCFQWGNILDLSYLEDVWTETIEASLKLSHQMCFELQILDLGGGLGISYTDDQELSFQDVHAV